MSEEHRRIQVYLRKEGAAAALSHLEFMRSLESAIRASGLPVQMTGGDPPRVRLSLPTALPQGMESAIEPVEIRVRRDVTVRRVLEAIGPRLPAGVGLSGADALYPGEKWAVAGMEYEIRAEGADLPDAAEIEALLARDRVAVERRGREMDLRPYLLALRRDGDALRVRIAWTDQGTARPGDVLRALGREPESFPVRKVGTTFRTSFGEEIVKPDDQTHPDQRPGTR